MVLTRPLTSGLWHCTGRADRTTAVTGRKRPRWECPGLSPATGYSLCSRDGGTYLPSVFHEQLFQYGPAMDGDCNP